MPTAAEARDAGIQISQNIPDNVEVEIHSPPGVAPFALPVGAMSGPSPSTFADYANQGTAGGTGGDGNGGGNETDEENPFPVGTPSWYAWRNDPYMAYKSMMGFRGRDYLAPNERYQLEQYNPLKMLFDVGQTMSFSHPQTGMMNQPYFHEWAPSYAQNPFAMYGLAKNMMGDVFSMTPEKRGSYGLGEGEGNIGQLLQMGLRRSMGGAASSWLGGRVPLERQLWGEKYPEWAPGGEQPSFLDYLKNKYNLGQYF